MTAFTEKLRLNGLFETKAVRYANAMAKVPYARITEIAWLSCFLPPNRRFMLDVMGGTGFVSDLISPLFQKSIIIDSVKAMLPPSSSNCVSITGDVTQEADLKRFINQIDLAVSLGGFHHIAVSDEATETVVRNWSNVLNPNGRLIIADVPSHGHPVNSTMKHIGLWPEMPELISRILQGQLSQEIRTFIEWSLFLNSANNNVLPKESEPAEFFDRVVATKCPNGHEANFQNIHTLKNIFSKVGLKNVSGFVLPTPWLFENRRQAAWFINELFAFGDQAVESPEAFLQEKVDGVIELIKKYLGVVDLSNGGCIVGWKLMIVVGDRD